MTGNDYIYAKATGTRAHKITTQARWQVFLQQLIDSGGNVNYLVDTRNCSIVDLDNVGCNKEVRTINSLS